MNKVVFAFNYSPSELAHHCDIMTLSTVLKNNKYSVTNEY